MIVTSARQAATFDRICAQPVITGQLLAGLDDPTTSNTTGEISHFGSAVMPPSPRRQCR
jgi:hypothetical protein